MMQNAKAKNPAFWEKVRTSEAYRPFVDELREMWERECGSPVPASRYSDFIMFDKTGSRTEYEDPYFLRRRQMNTSALLAMIYPEEERYISYLVDVMWAILNEYTWVVPAHMPTHSEYMVEHIDLFASETGFALSEIDYILEDRLPPLIRSRIHTEVDRRIIDNYLKHTYHWETSLNNWAAVCLNSVIGAIIYRRPSLVEELMPRIEQTVDHFLAGYPEDGICLEGFGYWHYGFGFFLCLADMLYEHTEGRVDYFKLPKVRAIAGFAQRMFLEGNVTVSFSDGHIKNNYHIGMVHYLKGKYPEDVTVLPREFSYTNDHCGRWCLHLRAILWFDETNETQAAQERTDYMPGAGWLIKVAPRYAFAGKGGFNEEPHNHNDLGAFIVVKGGQQILTDPGAGIYTKDYFREKRYLDFRASSRGHCVPIINGQYQVNGHACTSTTSYDGDVFTVDFAGGYDIPSLTSLRREFRFTDEEIVMRDTYTYDGSPESFVERFVATVKPDITGSALKLGDLTLIAGDTVEAVSVTEEVYAGVTYYCIDYRLQDAARTFDLRIGV